MGTLGMVMYAILNGIVTMALGLFIMLTAGPIILIMLWVLWSAMGMLKDLLTYIKRRLVG